MAPYRALVRAGGSIVVLIGADQLNLDRSRASEAPVLLVGGADYFDGIFVAGIMAGVLAGINSGGGRRDDKFDAPRRR